MRRVKSRNKDELLQTLRFSQASWTSKPRLDSDLRVLKSCKPNFRKTISSQIFDLRKNNQAFTKFPQLNITKPGHTKKVDNDFHTKNTAPGFSRNAGGKHYFK